MPPRTEPRFARQSPNIRSYPDGYDPSRIGTFPQGCPVPHGMITEEIAATGSRVPAPGQGLAPASASEAPSPASAAAETAPAPGASEGLGRIAQQHIPQHHECGNGAYP